MYACASASGEPRVPILTVLVATAEAKTTIEDARLRLLGRGAATARRAAAETGRALAEDEDARLCVREIRRIGIESW